MKFGPGFLFTFFYYFVMGTVITTIVSANLGSIPLSSGIPQRIGIGLGLVAGLLGGYCNQTTSFSVASTRPSALLNQLKALMTELGYDSSETIEMPDGEATQAIPQTILCYRRSGWRSLLSGKIFLCVGEKEVTVASRLIQLKRIQRQLDADMAQK